MLQIKRERKIRPYKKRKRIKEKKIELYKKVEAEIKVHVVK